MYENLFKNFDLFVYLFLNRIVIMMNHLVKKAERQLHLIIFCKNVHQLFLLIQLQIGSFVLINNAIYKMYKTYSFIRRILIISFNSVCHIKIKKLKNNVTYLCISVLNSLCLFLFELNFCFGFFRNLSFNIWYNKYLHSSLFLFCNTKYILDG